MQNTTNLNLKKPEYTDFADIQDINDNMDILDEVIHDTQNSVATFTSSDVADGSATSWTTVPKVDSGETHKSIFAKMSQMFKNVRFLYKLLGTTDISSIGDGTVTKALSVLNAKSSGTLTSNAGSIGSESYVYKTGNICTANIHITLTTNIARWGGFAEVPEGFVTAYTTFGILTDQNGKAYRIYILSGHRSLMTAAPLPSNVVYQGSIVYFVQA